MVRTFGHGARARRVAETFHGPVDQRFDGLLLHPCQVPGRPADRVRALCGSRNQTPADSVPTSCRCAQLALRLGGLMATTWPTPGFRGPPALLGLDSDAGLSGRLPAQCGRYSRRLVRRRARAHPGGPRLRAEAAAGRHVRHHRCVRFHGQGRGGGRRASVRLFGYGVDRALMAGADRSADLPALPASPPRRRSFRRGDRRPSQSCVAGGREPPCIPRRRCWKAC